MGSNKAILNLWILNLSVKHHNPRQNIYPYFYHALESFQWNDVCVLCQAAYGSRPYHITLEYIYAKSYKTETSDKGDTTIGWAETISEK